VSANIKGAKRV